MREFSSDISSSLAKTLSTLKLPKRNAGYSDWESFERKLRDVAVKYADIGFQWSLAETNMDFLRKYLVANSIILESLPVAYIDDRKQMLEKVFSKSQS